MHLLTNKPPMIVLIRLACPGQSTKVNCILPTLGFVCFKLSGDSITSALKPKSNVIPVQDENNCSEARQDKPTKLPNPIPLSCD